MMHESLECFNEAMNCLWRLESEAVGELFVRRGFPGPGLIYEDLAETFYQHATPIMLLAQNLSSLTISPVLANNKPEHPISITKGQAEAALVRTDTRSLVL